MKLFRHRVVMCCPKHYSVNYEINPWMHTTDNPIHSEAAKQWQNLHHKIIRLGGWVTYVTPEKNLPDMPFTANAGLVQDRKVVLSNFKHPERQGEQEHFALFFNGEGYKDVLRLPEDIHFEGAGDALFCGDYLFGGHGPRSSYYAYDYMEDFLDVDQIIRLELVDQRFYHLDTCFCPIADDLAIYFPGAFSTIGEKGLRQRINLIPVAEDEAAKFACNAVVLGKNIIIPSGCFKLARTLKHRGYQPHFCNMSEFIKSGGACKCLTLQL